MNELVPIEDILPGHWFTKRTGEHAYLKIYVSHNNYHGLNPGKFYGVCFNGNITAIEPGTIVKSVTVRGHLDNIQSDIQWHMNVGCKENPWLDEAILEGIQRDA